MRTWSPAFDPGVSRERDDRSNRYVLPQRVSKGNTVDDGLELLVGFEDDAPAIGKNEENRLVFELENHADATWTGTLDLTVPSGWSGPEERPATLEEGDRMEWDVTVRADDEVEPSYDLTFELHRTYDGSPWARETVDFSLVAATHWTVEGPDGATESVTYPGNHLRIFETLDTTEPGTYRAATTIRNPTARTIRLPSRRYSPCGRR